MRAIIVLAVVLLLLFVVGWITVGDSPERSTINIEKQQIRDDTAEMAEQGNELLDRARQTVTPEATTTEVAPASSAATTTESTPVNPSDTNAEPPLVEPAEPPQPPLTTTR